MDTWDNLKTKHNYAADEVVSALQKSIRRGNEEDAVFFAYEMMNTSIELAEKFWQRIRVISVEDIGLANPQLIAAMVALYENFKMLGEKEDRFLQGLMATILLCRSNKSRYIDELYNNIKEKVETEDYRREIPAYAIDKHTQKGEKLGKDLLHFWEEASQIKNDISENEKINLKEILLRIKK